MNHRDKNHSQKISNVPNLRFAGFEGEWVEKKLREIAEINPSNKSLPEKFIYIDLESVVNGELIKENEIVKSEAPSRAQRILKKNDVLFQMVRPYQMNNLYFQKNGDYIASTGYAQIRTKQNSHFVFQYLHYPKFVDKVIERCTGTSYPAINSTDLSNISISFPSISEQDKIAAFLALIDRRIQTQNKIIEKLETLIKGISDELFSQRLRFDGFEEGWNTYNVFDLLEFFSTNSLSWENLEYSTGLLFNLHYGLIHQGLPSHIDIAEYQMPSIKPHSSPRAYTLCEVGDIAFADASEDTNDVAKVVEFMNCDNKNIICGLHTIHARDRLDLTIIGFKGYAFSSKPFRNQIRLLAQGTKVFAISPKSFKECYIKIPSKNEQLKITQVLLALNKKIVIENKVLENLKNQKSYLLEKLFI